MQKHTITFLAIFTLFFSTGFAQSRAELDLAVNKFQTLYNTKQHENIFNMFSERIKALMPVEKTKETMGQLYQQVGEMKSYTFTKQEEHLGFYKANFEKSALTMVVSVDKDNKLETFRFIPFKDEATEPKEKSNIVFKSTTGDIFGTLQLPEGSKPMPVVLIIAGSGPTDRNGNQDGVKTNAYKLLADALLKDGIATVRYDKRGIGESEGAMKAESKLSFDDMINDAIGFVRLLKNDKRFSSVIVLGHSEGSLIGMIAAYKEQVKGYVSVAGIAEKADKIIVRQLAAQSEELSLKAAFIMDSMSKGREVKNIDPELESLFRPSIQPYIASWIKYDPQAEIKKLSMPVMILQGTTDLQVEVDEAEKLKAAYPAATLKIIDGMNHILKSAPIDRDANIATYNNISLPLAPGVSEAVSGFINSITKK